MLPNYAVHDQNQLVHPIDLESSSNVENVTDEHNQNIVADENISSSHTSDICNTFDYDSDSNNNNCASSNTRKMPNDKDIGNPCKDNENLDNDEQNKNTDITNITSVIKSNVDSFPPRTSVLSKVETNDPEKKNQYLLESSDDSKTKVIDNIVSMSNDSKNTAQGDNENNETNNDCNKNGKDIEGIATHSFKQSCDTSTAASVEESTASATDKPTKDVTLETSLGRENHDTLEQSNETSAESNMIKGTTNAGDNSANNVNRNTFKEMSYNVDSNTNNNNNNSNDNNCVNSLSNEDDKRREAPSNHNEKSFCDDKNTNNCNPSNRNYSYTNNINNSSNNTNGSSGNDGDKYNNVNNNNNSNNSGKNDICYNKSNDKKDEDVREINNIKDIRKNVDTSVALRNDDSYVCNVNVPPNNIVVNSENPHVNSNYINNKNNNEKVRNNNDNYVHNSNSNSNLIYNNSRRQSDCNLNAVGDVENKISKVSNNEGENNNIKNYGTNTCKTDSNVANTVSSAATYCSRSMENDITAVNLNFNHISRTAYKTNNDIDSNNNNNNNGNNISVDASNNSKTNVANYNPESKYSENKNSGNNDRPQELKNESSYSSDYRFGAKQMLYNNKGNMYPLDASEKYGITDRDSPVFYTTQQSIVASTITRMYGGAGSNEKSVYAFHRPPNNLNQSSDVNPASGLQNNYSRSLPYSKDKVNSTPSGTDKTYKIIQNETKVQDMTTNNSLDRFPSESSKRNSVVNEKQAMNLSHYTSYSSSHRQQGGDVSSKHIPGAQPAVVDNGTRNLYGRDSYGSYSDTYMPSSKDYQRTPAQANSSSNVKYKPSNPETKYADPMQSKSTYSSSTESLNNYVSHVTRTEKASSGYGYAGDYYSKSVNQYQVEPLRRSHSDIQIDYNNAKNKSKVSPAQSLTQLHMKPPDFSKMQTEVLSKGQVAPKRGSTISVHELTRRNSSELRYQDSMARTGSLSDQRHHVSEQHTSLPARAPYETHHLYAKPPNFKQLEEMRFVGSTNSVVKQVERVSASNPTQCCPPTSRQYEQKHPQLSSDVVMSIVPTSRPTENFAQAHSFRYPVALLDSRRMPADPVNISTGSRRQSFERGNVQAVYVDQTNRLKNVYDDKRTVDRRLPPHNSDVCCVKEPVSSQRQSQQMVYNSNENLRAGVISAEHPAKMMENKMYKNVSQEAHYMRNSEMNAYHRPEQTYPPTNPMMMKSSISSQSHSREYITSPQMESESSLLKQRQPKQVFLTRRTEDTYESWPNQTPPHPTRRHSNAGSPYDQYQPGSHNISSSYSTQPSPTHMQGIVKHSPSPVQSVQMPSSPIEVHNRPSPCANLNYNCTRGTPLEQSAYQTPYKNGPYSSEPIKTSTSFNNDRRSKEMGYTLPHNLKNEQNHAPPPAYIKETIQYKKIEPTESADRRYSSTTSQNPIVETVNRAAYSRSIKPEPKQDKRPNYRDMLNNALRNATSEDDLNYRIIKRTLNRDIPIPNTDTDLRKNIFDFPATGSQSTIKKTKAEPVFYNANLKEQSWGPDLQVRRSSVELRQSEWQTNEAKLPVADPSSSQRNLPTNRDFIRNDISVTITKIPGTVADSKRNYQQKEMARNSTCSNSTIQRPILPDVKIEPSKPRMQIVAPESSINSTSLPVDATIKRESPLDLSVKTVKTKADSTGVGDNSHYKGLKSRIPLPKFEFSPNFSKHAEKVTPDCGSNFFTRAPGLAPDCEITPSRAPSNYRRSSHDFPPRDYRISDSLRRETLPHKANISNTNYVQPQILEKRQTNPIPERYLHKVANRMPHEMSNKLAEVSPKIVKSIAEAPVIRSSESINKSMTLYSEKPPYSNRINEVDKCDPMMNRIKYNKSESPRIASFGSNEASSPCSTIMSHEKHFDMRIPPNNAICSNIPARTKDTSCIACVPCTGCNDKTCNKTKPMPAEPCRAECCLRTCNTYEYDPYNRNVRDVSTKHVTDEPSLYYSSSTEKPYCRDYPSKASVIENDITVTKKEPIHLLHYPDVPKDAVPYDNIPCKIYVKDEPVEKKMIDPVCLSIKEQLRSPDILLGHSTAPYCPSISYPGKLIDASMKPKDCSLLNNKIEYEAQSFTPPKVFKVEDANRKSAIQFCPQSSTVYPKQLNTPAVEPDNKHKDSRTNFLQQITPTAPRGIGADVISKLKNSIEQRGLEKQRHMIMTEAKNESQKEKDRAAAPDIASIIAARIRTKGELKGYLPIPEATAAEKEKSPVKEVVAVKAEIPPIANFEDTVEVKNLDLCDWTTTCNEFVEQLQSGTKKRRGKKRRSDRDFQTQPIVVAKKPNNMDGKSVVNRSFDIYSSDSRTENCRSYLDSSSEDDKPLLFFKRGSLTGSPFENDSTTSKEVLSSKFLSFENKDDFERKVESNMLLAMKSVEREKSTKAFREEVQKRFAASRSGTSNVDSEDESIRSHQRRRKFTKKQRQRPSNATHMYDFSDSDSCDIADERISSGSLSIKKDSPQRKRFIIKTSSESDSSKPLKKLPRLSFDEKRKEDVSNNTPSANIDSPKNEVLNSSLETDRKAEDEAEKSTEVKTLDSAISSPAETDSESTKKKETKEDFTTKPVEKSNKTIKEGKKQICDNIDDQKMTRSKHKREIEKSLANSKVLRNDKVIHDPFYEKERAQSLDKVVKRCSKEPPKTKCKAIKKDHESKPSEDATGDEKKTTKTNVDTSKEAASSDNLTDREQESLRTRLRSRDSKLPNDKTSSTTNNQKPGATRIESKDKIQDNNDKLIDLCKRGKVPKVVLTRKDKCFVKNLSPTKQQTETPPKKPELKSFPPGWEMEVYQYKRALKVPPSLISIKGPGHHRVSTSLPDLDSHSSDDTDISSDVNKKSSKGNEASQNTDADRKKAKKSNKIQSVQKEANKETKRKPEMEKEQQEEKVTSIIDVLHQRILRQNKSIKKSKQQTTNPRFIHPPSKETELLQTPDTGRNNTEASCSTNVFDTEILKSRTRTESRIMKNKELIREVFGGDERPASAPPEMQDIKIEPITFDEKYDEYLQKMNVDFGEKIRKNKTPGTNYIIPVIDIKQEKIDDESESTINDSKNEKNEFICSTATVNDMQFIPEPALPEDINAEQSNKNTFKQILFKKKNRHRPSRRKGSSGFDYIRKKKKPIQQSFNALAIRKRKKLLSIDMFPARNEDDICKEIQKWVLNKSVGQSALHKAARLGYIDVIVYCLERIGMNPDLKDNAGYTPLHEACSKGRLDIARLLLQYGANHSESAASGIRPLHEASESGSLEIVRLLLSYGADPLLTTYSGQTPLMLAETTDMEQFLKNHLEDVQSCGPFKQPWKFEGAWKIFDPHIYGYDTLSGVPNGKETVDKDSSWCKSDSSKINCEDKIQDKPSFNTDHRKELDSKSKQETTRNDHDREVENDKILVRDSTVISDKIRISMKCSVMLNSIGSLSCLKKFENNLHTQKYLQHGESNSNANNKICESNASDTDDNMFEFEESEMPLPPVYLLNDEGKEKWILLNDLCNLLKVKSKDTLLKQICPSMPPSTVNKQLLRELKMSDFLEKATCLQLLCAGEKINIRSSKVVLVKYNEKVKNLLGVKSILMQF